MPTRWILGIMSLGLEEGKIGTTCSVAFVVDINFYPSRICPGRFLALDSLFLTIAGTLHAFDIIPAVDRDGRQIQPELRVHPGAIIICHDRPWSVPMLARVLPNLQRRNYQIVTLTELLKSTET